MIGAFESDYNGVVFTCEWCFTSNICLSDSRSEPQYIPKISFSITYTPKNRKKPKTIKHDDLPSLKSFFDLLMGLRTFFYATLSQKVSDCIFEITNKMEGYIKSI